ncbi:peptide chain release factor 1 [Nonlabens sp. MIC269]|uniref:alternative ribosome rescue aminoacyl-tRNA hydrolase ArfB n=1 Tax=Nonlabens TaxID=363408 RepID=UPI000722F17A|nr:MULTISPECIES: alternative ribosome rescue aminoacyl-tRNA hydrolase ArfB [Nonlabens]ALM21135.1 peptide chain release factor 1 [Nonlabens sp. MIC269]PQJ20240.1 aminoacyl-tRNA hydrolase [Nonlabens tegetincola]
MNVEQIKNEVTFKAVASSGPGGQHANKVATKVQLEFDVINSYAFAEAEKQTILENLKSQLTQQGSIKISCQESRSQAKNKELVLKKLINLLAGASQRKKKRKKTAIPKIAKLKRLRAKKLNSEKKQNRKFKY